MEISLASLFKDCNTEIVKYSRVPKKMQLCHHEHYAYVVSLYYLLSLQTKDLLLVRFVCV